MSYCPTCNEPLEVCNEMRNKRSKSRLPNYQLGAMALNPMLPFTNYNATIVGRFSGHDYVITHWATEMFRLDADTKEIKFIYLPRISQTSSALIGKVVRSELVTPETLRTYVLANAESLGKPLARKWLRWCDAVQDYANAH